MTVRLKNGLLTLTLVATLLPVALDAQVRRRRQVSDGPGWTPIQVGARFGYDQNARGGGEVLGVHALIPVIPSGHLRLSPMADAIFVTGGREHQYSIEAVAVMGGRAGGLYGGGGIGRRTSSIPFAVNDPRESVSTYSIVAGVTSGFLGRFQTVVEFRWIFMDDLDVRPQPVTIGLSLPLWTLARTTS